jgi:subtilisin family serine protease
VLAWGLQRIGIEACWQRGFTGAGVRVGHLDTGVDGRHAALSGRIAEFVEFDGDGYPAPSASPRDSGSHGTHTAGVICGRPCDHLSLGVAPDAELCSGMVIEGGKCLVRLLAGLDWMLDCRVRVLCISLGIPMYNPLFEILLKRLKREGVLVIAPAGNRGSGQTSSPANYPGVIAVGAIDARDKVARFSGCQLFKRTTDFFKPNLVAPGVDVPSANPGGGLQIRSGTSMAAAHVAGVAALLFQAKPGASAAEVEEAILTTCTPLPESSEQRYGGGLINPVEALEAMLSNGRSKAGWRPTSTGD